VLRTLGESVYPENILQQWRDLFWKRAESSSMERAREISFPLFFFFSAKICRQRQRIFQLKVIEKFTELSYD